MGNITNVNDVIDHWSLVFHKGQITKDKGQFNEYQMIYPFFHFSFS
jgi:hypothetical protein